jgi:hypothetical protein
MGVVMRLLLDYLLGSLLLHCAVGGSGVCGEVSVWRSGGDGGGECQLRLG